jgi:hypothetical protein
MNDEPKSTSQDITRQRILEKKKRDGLETPIRYTLYEDEMDARRVGYQVRTYRQRPMRAAKTVAWGVLYQSLREVLRKRPQESFWST